MQLTALDLLVFLVCFPINICLAVVRIARGVFGGLGLTVLGLVLVVLTVMCLSWFQISFRTYLPSWLESQGRSLVAMGRMMFAFTACASVGWTPAP